eukprot:m.71106 g.71106  ORF g.71106 m.71106 type:complete len:55 (+) comp11694_c0_seq2:1973-2137(+)
MRVLFSFFFLAVIDRFGISTDYVVNVFALLVFIVIFRVCTYFALRRTLTVLQQS